MNHPRCYVCGVEITPDDFGQLLLSDSGEPVCEGCSDSDYDLANESPQDAYEQTDTTVGLTDVGGVEGAQ